jgi:hypothetical protein
MIGITAIKNIRIKSNADLHNVMMTTYCIKQIEVNET